MLIYFFNKYYYQNLVFYFSNAALCEVSVLSHKKPVGRCAGINVLSTFSHQMKCIVSIERLFYLNNRKKTRMAMARNVIVRILCRPIFLFWNRVIVKLCIVTAPSEYREYKKVTHRPQRVWWSRPRALWSSWTSTNQPTNQPTKQGQGRQAGRERKWGRFHSQSPWVWTDVLKQTSQRSKGGHICLIVLHFITDP